MNRFSFWLDIIALFLLSITLAVEAGFATHNKVCYETTEPIIILPTNTDEYINLENSPISVVSYFYASRIMNNRKWVKVVSKISSQDERLRNKLEEYEKWKIFKVTVLDITKLTEKVYLAKIFVETEINGKQQSIEDILTITLVNNNWLITSLSK